MGGICVFINKYFVYFVEIRMGSCVKEILFILFDI